MVIKQNVLVYYRIYTVYCTLKKRDYLKLFAK